MPTKNQKIMYKKLDYENKWTALSIIYLIN